MSQVFNQEYYGVDEGDQKPEFPFDPEIDDGILIIDLLWILKKHFYFYFHILENWDAYTGHEEEAVPSGSGEGFSNGPHCEDPDFNVRIMSIKKSGSHIVSEYCFLY